MLTPALYGFGVSFGNVGTDNARDHVRCEPLRGKAARDPWRRAVALDRRPRPLRLRLKGSERSLDRVGVEPAPLEIDADRLVAVGARGKRLGTTRGGPAVVDVPEAAEGREGVRSRDGVDARASEALLQLLRRPVTVP